MSRRHLLTLRLGAGILVLALSAARSTTEARDGVVPALGEANLQSAAAGLPASRATLAGVVLDARGEPVSDAIVRVRGTPLSAVTDRAGRFALEPTSPQRPVVITAWKSGYYNGGHEVVAGGGQICIRLDPIPSGDNHDYAWRSPSQSSSTGDKPCRECHPALAAEWDSSAHAGSAQNPLFLAFFGGTDVRGAGPAGPGYRLDFPGANGNCSSCHVPAMALARAYGSDPRAATGIEREGIFCDLCHKVAAARVDEFGGHPGILSMEFARPSAGRGLFYGPYDDVFPGDDSRDPLVEESVYCAPCHNGAFWNTPVYTEFQEWRSSDYAARGITCQACHMKADGSMARFALESKGGVLRDPATVPSHRFYGMRDRAFMISAIDLGLAASWTGDALAANVTVRNTGAGHAYPTGNPMRHMILRIDARDEGGNALELTEGDVVPPWGGAGSPAEGNYAGQPGRGFGKVLVDASTYPDRRDLRFPFEYPAPHWRPVRIESDTRIPANGMDVSRYQFAVPPRTRGTVEITATLIYRRTYKQWADAKGLGSQDLELGRKHLTIRRDP